MDGNPFARWHGKLNILTTKFIYDNGVLFDEEKKKIIAFRRNDTSYKIPDNVTSIGISAFENCKSLSSIVIPDSVTSIEDFAFLGCESLCNIVIPNSVTSIGKSAFSYCDSLPQSIENNIIARFGNKIFEIEP